MADDTRYSSGIPRLPKCDDPACDLPRGHLGDHREPSPQTPAMADDTETRWRFTCENIAQATPREWGALDQRYYDAGLALIAAVRAEPTVYMLDVLRLALEQARQNGFTDPQLFARMEADLAARRRLL